MKDTVRLDQLDDVTAKRVASVRARLAWLFDRDRSNPAPD